MKRRRKEVWDLFEEKEKLIYPNSPNDSIDGLSTITVVRSGSATFICFRVTISCSRFWMSTRNDQKCLVSVYGPGRLDVETWTYRSPTYPEPHQRISRSWVIVQRPCIFNHTQIESPSCLGKRSSPNNLPLERYWRPCVRGERYSIRSLSVSLT